MKTIVTSFSGLSISTVHSRTMDEREGEREEKKHFSLTNDIFWGIMKEKSNLKFAAAVAAAKSFLFVVVENDLSIFSAPA